MPIPALRFPRFAPAGSLRYPALFTLAVLLVVAVLAVVYSADRMKAETLQLYDSRANMLSRIGEDHLSRALQQLRQIMLEHGDRWSTLPPAERQGPQGNSLLAAGIERQPMVRSLSVATDDGWIVASSNSANTGRKITLPAGPGQPAIGLPLAGRDLGSASTLIEEGQSDILPVSLTLADGHRLIAALNLDYFRNFLTLTSDNPRIGIDILRYDGFILLSTGELEPLSLRLRQQLLHEWLPVREIGSLQDDNGTLVSFRAAREFPLVVLTRVPESVALAQWNSVALQLGLIVGIALLLAGCMAGALLYLMQRHARQRQHELARLDTVFGTLPIAVAELDADGRITMSNHRWDELMNLAPGTARGRHISPLLSGCKLCGNADDSALARLLAGLCDGIDSEIGPPASQPPRHFRLLGRSLPQRNGYIVMLIDISVQKQQQQQADLAATVFSASRDGIVITDATTRILKVNQAFCDITGYSPEEAVGQTSDLLASGLHDAAFYHGMWQTLRDEGLWQGEIVNRRKDGSLYHEWLTISAVRSGAGQAVQCYVGLFADISERKTTEARLNFLSDHDPLTGLHNRDAFGSHLDQVIESHRDQGLPLALILIDLDHFKNVNDTLGHSVGDSLLRQVGQALANGLRAGDRVCRQGGDEFAVLIPAVRDRKEVADIARRLNACLSRTFHVDGIELNVTASLGIALFPDDGATRDELMQHADLALYASKADGRANQHFFEPGMDRQAQERVMIEQGIRNAVDREELRLVYQPQFDLQSGRIVGAEALLRWQHPDIGAISPSRFIPVAEETRLIELLGDWVLEEACRMLARWQGSGQAGTMAVNISARQVSKPDFAARIEALLKHHQVDPRRLELEITERTLIHTANLQHHPFQRLRALGVRVALDDFGTGYSSLAYLRRFPLDQIKIDRSFVMNLPEDKDDMLIVQTIIGLAHNLGLKVVAEGAETLPQVDYLRRQDCDIVQGFYFSRPLEAEDFLTRIRQDSEHALQPL